MTAPITITMPLALTPDMIRAVREHPTTSTTDQREWHRRLGWLLCAWDVLAAHRVWPDSSPDGMRATCENKIATLLDDLEAAAGVPVYDISSHWVDVTNLSDSEPAFRREVRITMDHAPASKKAA